MNKIKNIFFLNFALLLALSISFHAYAISYRFSYLQPNDQQYYRLATPEMDLIFTDEHRPFLKDILAANKKIQQDLSKSFHWQLDEKPAMVLASTNTQVANAFATVMPYPLTAIYSAGLAEPDYFASSSWYVPTILHETAHLYQLNSKQGLGEITHTLFGNHAFLLYPLIPIPVTPSPNIITPTWLLEGSAVMNESRFGQGGRLHQGIERALFYTLLRHDLLNEKRLTNNHNSFPYRREKYVVGSYFMRYLAEKYGVEKTNSFFYAQATHWFYPFILNDTFKQHFGMSYSEAILDFLNSYSQQAVALKTTADNEGTLITHTQAPVEFSAPNKEHVLVMSSADNISPLRLFRLNRSTLQVEKEENSDLLKGRVFSLQNVGDVSASTFSYQHQSLIYGLWDEHHQLYPGSESVLVLAQNDKTLLGIDMRKSLDQIKLVRAEIADHLQWQALPYSAVNSTPVLDQHNNVFYFTQNTDGTRTLKQNDQKLFSFAGVFSQLVAVDDAKGLISFIANTDYGSSLYAWSKKTHKIYRLSPSDAISNAIHVAGDSYLIEEIGPTGYDIKLVQLPLTELSSSTAPVVYHSSIFNTGNFNEEKNSAEVPLTSSYQETPYHDFTSLRYSNWSLQHAYSYSTSSGSSYITAVTGKFSDPLQHNAITAQVLLSDQPNNRLQSLAYENKSTRLLQTWRLSYVPVERDRYRQHIEESLTLAYPLPFNFLVAPWHSKMLGQVARLEKIAHPYSFYLSNRLSFEKSFALSFAPYRFFSWAPEYRHETLGHQRNNLLSYQADFGNENLFGLEIKQAYSTSGGLYHGRPLNKFLPTPELYSTIPTEIQHFPYRQVESAPRFSSLSADRYTLGVSKVFKTDLYSSRVPLGILRVAPRIFHSYLEFKQNNHLVLSSREYGLGLTTEFLLAHIQPWQLQTDFLRRERDEQYSFQMRAAINLD